MSSKRSNKRVYARIVSLKRLMMWQFTTLMMSIAITLAFNWYHHEMTMMKLDGMVDTTVKAYKICNHVGIKDCMEIRKILKDD